MKSFICLWFIVCFVYVNSLECIDENNNPVDWYILYKIPHIKKNAPNQLIKNGFAYMYITSENATNWTLSNINIMDSKNSFLAKTLTPIYENKDTNSLAYIFYNDEKPNKHDKLTKGHTKGVLATDTKKGFWLVHSVPLFPPKVKDGYSYPLSGTVYGQSILCISLNASNVNLAGGQLQYNEPQVYDSNFPNDFAWYMPNLRDVINHVTIDNPPWFKVQSIKTLKNEEFISFAKMKYFSKELYEDLVAPGLNSNLIVETWLNGAGKLPSNCTTKYSVKNLQTVQLKPANVTFPSSLDHSKWAVSDGNVTWTCIGDINRAEHQKKRGGGTVCLNNPHIASLYYSLIGTIEKCSSYLLFSKYLHLL